jgi:hypothetical protein
LNKSPTVGYRKKVSMLIRKPLSCYLGRAHGSEEIEGVKGEAKVFGIVFRMGCGLTDGRVWTMRLALSVGGDWGEWRTRMKGKG